jgi:hypothetical protein
MCTPVQLVCSLAALQADLLFTPVNTCSVYSLEALQANFEDPFLEPATATVQKSFKVPRGSRPRLCCSFCTRLRRFQRAWTDETDVTSPILPLRTAADLREGASRPPKTRVSCTDNRDMHASTHQIVHNQVRPLLFVGKSMVRRSGRIT